MLIYSLTFFSSRSIHCKRKLHLHMNQIHLSLINLLGAWDASQHIFPCTDTCSRTCHRGHGTWLLCRLYSGLALRVKLKVRGVMKTANGCICLREKTPQCTKETIGLFLNRHENITFIWACYNLLTFCLHSGIHVYFRPLLSRIEKKYEGQRDCDEENDSGKESLPNYTRAQSHKSKKAWLGNILQTDEQLIS